jgi:hypothetical protein
VIECKNDKERQQCTNKFAHFLEEQKNLYSLTYELNEFKIIKEHEYYLRPLNKTGV